MPASDSIAAELTAPQQKNLQGDIMGLAIEKFETKVQMVYKAESEMEGYHDVIELKGTNHASMDALGDVVGAPLVRGVAPVGTKIERGRGKVYVKTPYIARSNFSELEDVQDNIGVKGKTADIQGKHLAEVYDKTVINKAIQTAFETDPTKKKVSDFNLGTVKELSAVGDEEDSTKLEAGINAAVIDMMKKTKSRPTDAVIRVDIVGYNTLARNEKLIDRDLNTGNGEYSQGTVMRASGVPIKVSYFMPEAAGAGYLPDDENGTYAVSAEEAKTVALIQRPSCLIVGRSIALQSKVWWNEDNKCWYVDSWYAFGCAANRYEDVAVVTKKTA